MVTLVIRHMIWKGVQMRTSMNYMLKKRNIRKRGVALGLATLLLVGSVELPTYAAGSSYQTLTIASDSLNGNSIWGPTEGWGSNITLDDSAAFYSQASSRNGGVGGLPTNGRLDINGVPYQFSAKSGYSLYDNNDCIRLNSGVREKTMNLQTIGSYSQIYVLGTAGGPGTGHYANFSVNLNYTDGTKDTTEYRLYDWFDGTSVSNVYKYANIMRRNNSDGSYDKSTSGAPYLQSATISANSGKLLKSITFKLTGKDGGSNTSGLNCGVYAVTGMVNANAPAAPTGKAATNVNTTDFVANWNAVGNATGYRLDVATDSNFSNIISGFNNLNVGNCTSYKVTGLSKNTSYYYRVRAVNNSGTSLSSSNVSVKTSNTYRVTFDGNGYGSSITGGSYCDIQVGTTISSNLTNRTVTRTGYTFNGWYTAASGGTKVTTSWVPSANTTLYAQWTPNIYTFTLNGDGATNSYTRNIYVKYDNGYYSNSGATTSISKVIIPAITDKTFQGYYINNTKVIDRKGNILTSAWRTNSYNTNQTFIAKYITNSSCETQYVTSDGTNHFGTLQEALEDSARDITVINNTIVSTNTTIPSTTKLHVSENKNLSISGNTLLTNLGEITNEGVITGATDSIKSTGTVVNQNPSNNLGPIVNGEATYTDSQGNQVYQRLEVALNSAPSTSMITVADDTMLNKDLTIQVNKRVELAPNVTLTIPNGKQLNNQGSFVNNGNVAGGINSIVNTGTIESKGNIGTIVYSQASYEKDGKQVYSDLQSALEKAPANVPVRVEDNIACDNEITIPEDRTLVVLPGANITGDKSIVNKGTVENQSGNNIGAVIKSEASYEIGNKTVYTGLNKAMDEINNNETLSKVTVEDRVTLKEGFVVPEGVILEVAEHATLVIPEGSTMDNKGEIINHGTIEGDDKSLINDGVVTDSNTEQNIRDILKTESHYNKDGSVVYTNLKDAIQDVPEDEKIFVQGEVDIEGEFEIPAGTKIEVEENGKLNIKEDGELINNGEIDNKGTIDIDENGGMTNKGTLNNKNEIKGGNDAITNTGDVNNETRNDISSIVYTESEYKKQMEPQINNQLKETINSIKNNPSLSEGEKQETISQASKVQKDATTTIADPATTGKAVITNLKNNAIIELKKLSGDINAVKEFAIGNLAEDVQSAEVDKRDDLTKEQRDSFAKALATAEQRGDTGVEAGKTMAEVNLPYRQAKRDIARIMYEYVKQTPEAKREAAQALALAEGELEAAKIDANEELTDEQKEQAKDAISDATSQTISQIQGLPGDESLDDLLNDALTKQKESNKKTEDQAKQQAQDNQNAQIEQNKNDVDKAQKEFNDPDSTLVDKQNAADDLMDSLADLEKAKIDAMSELTDEEKEKLKEEIDQIIEEAKSENDKATSKEDVEEIMKKLQDETVKKLQEKADEQNKSNAKDEAKEELKEDIQKRIDEINVMDDLTDEQKQDAIDKLKETLDEILQAIDELELPDTDEEIWKEILENVAQSKDDSFDEIIDDANAQEFANQKEKAEEKIREELEKVLESIDADESTTDEQKDALKEAMQERFQEILEQLEDEDDLENVDSSIQDANKQLEDEILDCAQDNAIKEMEEIIADQKKKIEDSSSYTDAEKEQMLEELDRIKEELEQDIKSTKTFEEIEKNIKEANKEVADYILENTESDYDLVKENSLVKLEAETDLYIQEIQNNKNLTESEKKAAIDKINAAKEKAEQAIKDAKPEDISWRNTMDKALTKALSQMEEATDATADKTLANSKKNSIDAINTKVEESIAKVEAMENLSEEQKTSIINEMKQQQKDAIAAIEDAESVTEVDLSTKVGLSDILSTLSENTSDTMEHVRENALEAIQAKADAKIAEIEHMDQLTKAEKETAIAQIQKEKEKAVETIENSKYINEAKKAQNKALDSMDEAVSNSREIEVANAKENAITKITSEKEQQIANIKNMQYLTEDEKADRIEAIENRFEEIIEEIKKTSVKSDVIEVAKDFSEELQDNASEVKKENILAMKEYAREEIQAKAQQEIQAIQNMNITAQEKNAAIAAVQKKQLEALAKLEESDSLSTLEAILVSAAKDMKDVTYSVIPQNKQNAKDVAKAKLQSEAEAKIAEINAMTDLTQREREQYINEVKKTLDAALESIDRVNMSSVDLIQRVEKIYQDSNKKMQEQVQQATATELTNQRKMLVIN